MSVRIFIPARMSSKRLPNKPLKYIGEKTLIEHVYDQATQTGFPVTILTDTNEIGDRFPHLEVLVTDDCLTGTDRISLVCNKYQETTFVNCQGDLPFITPQNIVHSLLALRYADVGTLIAPLQEDKLKDPNVVKASVSSIDNQFYKINWCGRGLNEGYHHVGVYAFEKYLMRFWPNTQSKGELKENLEQLRWIENGLTVSAFKINDIPIEINTNEDLILANERRKGLGGN